MAGSFDPDPLDEGAVSPGPWADDAGVDVQIEDANGHKIARVFKTSDLDSSSLPWTENKQLIQDAIGYARQAADRLQLANYRLQELHGEENRETMLEAALQDIARHPSSARRVTRRLRDAGLI